MEYKRGKREEGRKRGRGESIEEGGERREETGGRREERGGREEGKGGIENGGERGSKKEVRERGGV